MAQPAEKINIDTIIPFFNLPSDKGGYIKTWDFKQRKHLVIYFFGGAGCTECKSTLSKFTEHYADYRRLNAEVLAIGKDSLDDLTKLAEELRLPYPVLSDATGEVTNRYTYINPATGMPYPSIFVADKYGSLEEEWVVSQEHELPSQEQLLSLLQLFELRCPE